MLIALAALLPLVMPSHAASERPAWSELRAMTAGVEPVIPAALDAKRGPRLPGDRLNLPIVEQQTDFSCGPASLLSVLRYWTGFRGTERDLYGPLETTPKDGTEPAKLAEYARGAGLSAEVREGMTLEDLRAALGLGRTVIVDLQAWSSTESARLPWRDRWEDGHYVVLAAMDAANAYFMDPSAEGALAWVPLSELPERWHDYEDRHGQVERNDHLGVVIFGDAPRHRRPQPARAPVRMR